MPTPTHSQPQPLPSELFTDREVSKKRFKENLDKPQLSAEYRILSWFGVGGQGKTALVEEFDRILKSKQATARSIPPLAHALIDFENANNRAIATALLAIRGQLHATSGLHFPTFEFACLRYLALTQPDVDLKDLRTRFFTAGAPYLDSLLQAMFALGELGGAVHAIPGFSLITKYGTKLLGKAGQTFIDWWNDSGGRTLYDIDELSQDALLRRLPSCFGADLMDALARKRPPRIVIMLDTYEALWRGRGLRDGPGALRIDDWVRLLVQDSPGVMFIIFGRDKLRWHEIDPEARWNDVISEYLLGGLNRRDANALLIKWRVQESTIRIRMIAGSSSGESHTVDEQTEAYLPFYLELQALTYRNITAQGRVPRPEDFGSDQPQILARFLEHLDGESDKLLRVASYLSALDSEVLDMLSDKFLGGRASTDWSRLYGRSLISEEREGLRFVHNLLRKALQKREQDDRPELYRDIHQALFDWFDIRSGSSELSTVAQEQEPAVLAAIRHLSQFDQKKAVHWASTQMPQLDEAGKWRILEEVCQLVLPLAETNYGAEHRLTTTIWSWLAAAALSNGHYVEAEALYKRVQATQERTLGPNHPSTARTLASLANLYGDTGRYVEAEALYEHVRVIQERALGAEHPSTVTTLANLAKVYRDTGRYGEAEALYEFVQAIQERTFGPEHPWTTATVANLASVYGDTGRYALAEPLFKRVWAIREKVLGPEHPLTATTLGNLASLYLDTGRYAEAEALQERVRAIKEKIFGLEHPSTAKTLANLARVFRDTGRYAEAEALYKRVQAIQEKTLGQEHPLAAMTLANLACGYRDTGRYAEAEALHKRVLAIQERTLGPEHPSTATTLANLANVYSDSGRYSEAEALLSARGRSTKKFSVQCILGPLRCLRI